MFVPFAPEAQSTPWRALLRRGSLRRWANRLWSITDRGWRHHGRRACSKGGSDGYTLLVSAFEMSINPTMRSKLNYDVISRTLSISRNSRPRITYSPATRHTGKNGQGSDRWPRPARDSSTTALGRGRRQPSDARAVLGDGGHPLGACAYKVRRLPLPQSSAAKSTAPSAAPTRCFPQVLAGRARPWRDRDDTRRTVTDLPTIGESAVPGYVVTGWVRFYAPAGTPPDVIRRLYAETKRGWRVRGKGAVADAGQRAGGEFTAGFLAFARAEGRQVGETGQGHRAEKNKLTYQHSGMAFKPALGWPWPPGPPHIDHRPLYTPAQAHR